MTSLQRQPWTASPGTRHAGHSSLQGSEGHLLRLAGRPDLGSSGLGPGRLFPWLTLLRTPFLLCVVTQHRCEDGCESITAPEGGLRIQSSA